MSKKNLPVTVELFVGARLGAARAKAGISLEQAARDTRIRVQRLKEIETDDFSGFAHPTYARLFLLDYAAYLGVPADEIRPLLPDQTAPSPAGFQYLDALDHSMQPREGLLIAKRRRRRLVATIVSLLALIAILVIGIYFWRTLQKIDRITPRSAEMTSGSPTPTPEPSPTPEPPAITEPPPEPAAPALWELTPEATPTPSL